MTWRRILYAGFLCASVFYYIFHTGYFSWMLLVLTLILPAAQLLLSFYIWRTTHLALRCAAPEVGCGFAFTLLLQTTARLPVCKVRVKLCTHNLFTGDKAVHNVTFLPGYDTQSPVELPSKACGAVQCNLQKPRMLDLMGLFALPLAHSYPVMVLVRPAPIPPAPQLPPQAGWQTARPAQTGAKPGPGALREYQDIREYRDGDLMRDVHWKLSAKQDKLIVREAGAPVSHNLQLGFLFGSGQNAVCAVLARLQALSAALLQMEMPHTLLWVGPQGEMQMHYIDSYAAYESFLFRVLGQAMPQQAETALTTLLSANGPLFLVEQTQVSLYENGLLREVLQ